MIIGDFNDKGLSHSYPNTPPGYSNPQILYKYHYEGFLTAMTHMASYVWSIEPPFYITEGQGTREITCELLPTNSVSCSELKSSIISLDIGRWNEGTAIYYKRGPKWRIEGNINPNLNSIEKYTLIPDYDQSGFPPNCSTLPDSYNFKINNGEIVKFYGNVPPVGNPIVDIHWHTTGSTYISFYSSWTNEQTSFPTTLNVYVSETSETPRIETPRIEIGGKKIWSHEERPEIINSNNTILINNIKKVKPTEFSLALNLKETITDNFPFSWNIIGNETPIIKIESSKIIKTIEKYILVPIYENEKNTQLPNKYFFTISKGKILNFYLDINPSIEILWLESGSTQISFYTEWENRIINPPINMNIFVSQEEFITPVLTNRIETGEKKLWKKQERPVWIHGSK